MQPHCINACAGTTGRNVKYIPSKSVTSDGPQAADSIAMQPYQPSSSVGTTCAQHGACMDGQPLPPAPHSHPKQAAAEGCDQILHSPVASWSPAHTIKMRTQIASRLACTRSMRISHNMLKLKLQKVFNLAINHLANDVCFFLLDPEYLRDIHTAS